MHSVTEVRDAILVVQGNALLFRMERNEYQKIPGSPWNLAVEKIIYLLTDIHVRIQPHLACLVFLPKKMYLMIDPRKNPHQFRLIITNLKLNFEIK